MKNVITSAIFVAITATSAFAGEKAQNLIDPVQVKISGLETQVDGLKTVATSLALQLRAALDNQADPEVIADLQAQIDYLEEDKEYYYEENEMYDNWVSELKVEVNTLETANEALELAIDGYQGQLVEFETQAGVWFNEQETIQADLNDTITDQALELEAVYADLDQAYEDMDLLQDTNIDLHAALDSNVNVEALTNLVNELDAVAVDQEATIAAYDAALDEIASIVEGGNDNALEEVLSFISSLDLNI